MTQQAPEQFQADTPPKTLAQQQCEMSGWLLAAMHEVKESSGTAQDVRDHLTMALNPKH